MGAKAIALNDTLIRAMEVPKGPPVYHWDSKLKGFGIRVSAAGTKSFVVLVKSGKRQTIGRYPAISLSDARTEARRIQAEKTLGRVRPDRMAYQDAVDLFLAAASKKNRPRTVADYKRLLGRLPFGRKPLYDIRKRDILNALPRAPSEARHVLVGAKIFFSWCERNEYVQTSPTDALKVPRTAPPRDRVLSDDELAKVFNAARSMPHPFGPIVVLLILTGQRRGEIAALRWDYLEHDRITLPSALTKNKREHSVPLSSSVKTTLEELPQLGELLFPPARSHVRGRPTTVYNGWPKDLEALKTAARVSHFTLHDLRRTFATNQARLGTPIHVVEKLLNHVSGALAGVAGIYNRYSYWDEMVTAMQRHEDFVLSVARQ